MTDMPEKTSSSLLHEETMDQLLRDFYHNEMPKALSEPLNWELTSNAVLTKHSKPSHGFTAYAPTANSASSKPSLSNLSAFERSTPVGPNRSVAVVSAFAGLAACVLLVINVNLSRPDRSSFANSNGPGVTIPDTDDGEVLLPVSENGGEGGLAPVTNDGATLEEIDTIQINGPQPR